jgi:hypothetical protein
MSDAASILLTVASTAVGSAASWFISRWYYRQSGSDLDSALQPLTGDQRKLLQATNALGRMLEQAGIGKPTFDEAGNLTGVVVFGKADNILGHAMVKASGFCTPPPQYDRQHEQPAAETSGGGDA